MVIALLIGLALSFLAGLGIGGGSLLMLWLTLIAQIPQTEARGINLMFFLAAAGSVSLIRWRKGTLDIKKLLPAMLCGCAAAAVFSWLGQRIPHQFLEKLFGGLLLLTGIKELFYRPRKAK